MMEIFFVQLLAAGLGGASTALADWAYRSARINQRAHSIWVACSIAVICLPILVWMCDVFLGSGILGRIVVGFLAVVLFAWVYSGLQRLPAVAGSAGRHLGATPASAAASQAARRGRLTF